MMNRYLDTLMMMAMVAFYTVTAIPTIQAQRSLPPGISISAVAEPSDLMVGDLIDYRVIIRGNVNAQSFDFPSFNSVKGISLVAGPSNFYQMTNGDVVTERRFRIRADQPGTVTIPPTTIRINGYDYPTNEVTLRIQDLSTSSRGVISARITQAVQDRNAWNAVLDGKLFAKAEFPERVYKGQVVPVTVYIYRDELESRINFRQYNISEDASGNDFLFPQAKHTNQKAQQFEKVTWDKRPFERVPILTLHVVPTKSGKLVLTPPMLTVFLNVTQNSNNRPRSGFLQYSTRTIQYPAELRMNPIVLDVLDLPEQPTGTLAQVVGSATPSVKVDRTEMERREILTVTLEVIGEGYFGLITPPDLSNLKNFIQIDSKADTTMVVDDDIFISRRLINYTFQATNVGEVEIPSLSFAIVNPESGLQRIEKTEPIEILITEPNSDSLQLGDAVPMDGTNLRPSKEDTNAKVLGQDVAYISTAPLDAEELVTRSPFYTKPWFYAVQFVPLSISLAAGGLLLMGRIAPADQRKAQAKKSRKEALLAFVEAEKHTDDDQPEAFYQQLNIGMMKYIAALLGCSEKGLIAEEIANELVAMGHDQKKVEELLSICKQCDTFRYSPLADTADARQGYVSKAKELLADLERNSS